MAKPKIKRYSDKLEISFWDEGPEGDKSGSDDLMILEMIFLLIIFIFIDKSTIIIDRSSATLTYQKKKIFRKAKVETYNFNQISKLSMHRVKRKGFLEATINDRQLRLLPKIKKRKLKKLSDEISKVMNKPIIVIKG